MAADSAETQPATATGGKSRLVSVVIVAVLMLGEGVGIFYLANAISPDPPAAQGEEVTDNGLGAGLVGADTLAEVELAECRPSNRMAGKFVTFHIRVSALVAAVDLERVQEIAEAKRGRIEDAVNVVIRGSEPKHLNEPELETLRRRLKFEFDRIFADKELIKRVLIPQMLQSGSGV